MSRVPGSLVLLLLLAGCTTPNADDAATTGPVIITDPRDTGYLLNGTQSGSHIHDYWKGRSAVTVLEYDGGKFSASCGGCGDGMQIIEARPEEGDIVPQGTAWLNVTVSWATSGDTSDFGEIRLLLRSAKDHDLQAAGPVENGVTRVINTTNEEDDPPHYVLSLWRFGVEIVPRPGSDSAAFAGSFKVRVEAVRGLPLVPYPPHPDRWQGVQELPLASDEQTIDLQYEEELQGGTATTCYGGCLGHIAPLDGAVVPVETGTVLVTVEFAPGSVPGGVGLRFHAADTWALATAQGEASLPPGVFTWTIPISGNMADSPYAPQSLWEFELFLDEPTPVRAWSGTYTFTATSVHR